MSAELMKTCDCALNAQHHYCGLAEEISSYKNHIAALESCLREKDKALAEYGEHGDVCILASFSQGRPTADGGYEVCYKGRWYQSIPVDNTPKCNCGLAEALALRPKEG